LATHRQWLVDRCRASDFERVEGDQNGVTLDRKSGYMVARTARSSLQGSEVEKMASWKVNGASGQGARAMRR
jgi:hypothetical protein